MLDSSLIVRVKEANLMASPSHPEMPCTFRFEFDPVNKILLIRLEGRLTDELYAEPQRAFWKHWAATDASAAIVDFSSVTEFALSTGFVRRLVNKEVDQELVQDLYVRPRVVVATTDVEFGLARMYQILGEGKHQNFKVVHTMDEAFIALDIQSPLFEPLE